MNYIIVDNNKSVVFEGVCCETEFLVIVLRLAYFNINVEVSERLFLEVVSFL